MRIRCEDEAAITRSTVTSRDGEVETGSETVDAVTGAAVTAPRSCNLTSARFTSIPSGTLAAVIAGGRLQASFAMEATFASGSSCSCASGEYRQYMRGTYTAGGRTVNHMLGPGRPLHPTRFQEDGDVATGTVYGHRSVLGTRSRFRPDQAVGCDFEGADTPFIKSSSGTFVTMDLDFRGQLIDTSASNRVLRTASWSVVGWGTIP